MEDMRQWVYSVRSLKNICMLVPMDAVMGYPFPVNGKKHLLCPFFRVEEMADRSKKYHFPFAFILVEYPGKRLITYVELERFEQWDRQLEVSKIYPQGSSTGHYPEALYQYLTSDMDITSLEKSLAEEVGPFMAVNYRTLKRVADSIMMPGRERGDNAV